MAIEKSIINAQWEGQLKSYIENGLKTILQGIVEQIEAGVADGSVGVNSLSPALHALVNNAVQNTLTVNGHRLNQNIELDADDVGAVPSAGYVATDNNFTTALKNKLNGIEEGAEVNVIKGIKANGASENITPDEHGVVELPAAGPTIEAATDSPQMDGNAAVGTSAKYAREDHVHPSDISKQDAIDNLATIIANAAKGATAVQKVKVGSNGTEVSPDQSGLATLPINIIPTIDQVTGNWVINGIDSGVRAQGPKGDSVIGGSVELVNSFAGGEGKALTAEMGKVLRNAIITLYNAFANYAFYGTKPTLNWGSTVLHFGMSATLSNVTISSIKVNGVTQSYSSLSEIDIAEGQSLEVTLDLPSNLYVIDDDTFSVKMSGDTLNTNIQGNSIVEDVDDAQVVISIASVNGNVSIVANGLTYVSNGLVLHLDGKNRGGTSGSWKDLVNTSRAVAFTGGVTENSDNLQLDGTAIGIGDFADNVSYNSLTWECVIEQASKTNPNKQQTILLIGKTGSAIISVSETTYLGVIGYMFATHSRASADSITVSTPVFWFNSNVNTKYSISHYGTKMIQNGTTVNSPGDGTIGSPFKTDYNNKTLIGGKVNASDVNVGFNGKIYAIRIYSRVLDDNDALHNWKIDKKRFNIS